MKNLSKYFHSEERILFIKELPCSVCSKLPSDNAHIKSRGSGGTWKDVVPLCRIHHQELDTTSLLEFEKEYNVNLSTIADSLVSFFS